MRKAITIPLSQATRAIRQRQYGAWRIGGGGGGGGGGIGTGAGALVQPSLLLIQARRPISNCAIRRSDNENNNGFTTSAARSQQQQQQSPSSSPQGRVGVAAALAAAEEAAARGTGQAAATVAVRPTLWDEFALRDRVALVSGANRGLGLEMALTLIEAGARAVYCVDLPEKPGKEWIAVAEYVKRMVGAGGRLEYVCADVRDQKAMWKIGEEIGDKEGRMDVCVAAAGILRAHTDCLEYPGEEFEEVRQFISSG